jgi:chloride channel 3/4/5
VPIRPRVVLIEDHGRLLGLVTVKDVLRFTAAEERAEGHSGWDPESMAEAWDWISGYAERSKEWLRRVLRR